jgi:hypothetical protein
LFQLPPDILGGKFHRYDAGFIPGTFFALNYTVRFINNIVHQPTPDSIFIIAPLPLTMDKTDITSYNPHVHHLRGKKC